MPARWQSLSRDDGAMTLGATRTPILIGESGSSVVRVRREDGLEWIEKTGSRAEIELETAVLEWCAGRLPVAKVLRPEAKVLGKGVGFLAMSALPGVNLTETSMERAAQTLAEALQRIHATPIENCPFMAGWALRVSQVELRVRAGLVDESDFDEDNLGRSPTDILAELQSLPPLPDVICFTHGDACLPNFLTQDGRLTGSSIWHGQASRILRRIGPWRSVACAITSVGMANDCSANTSRITLRMRNCCDDFAYWTSCFEVREAQPSG
jgi:aminoglycoside phosphotransferase